MRTAAANPTRREWVDGGLAALDAYVARLLGAEGVSVAAHSAYSPAVARVGYQVQPLGGPKFMRDALARVDLVYRVRWDSGARGDGSGPDASLFDLLGALGTGLSGDIPERGFRVIPESTRAQMNYNSGDAQTAAEAVVSFSVQFRLAGVASVYPLE